MYDGSEKPYTLCKTHAGIEAYIQAVQNIEDPVAEVFKPVKCGKCKVPLKNLSELLEHQSLSCKEVSQFKKAAKQKENA